MEASKAQEARGTSEPSSPDAFNAQSLFNGHELSPQRSVGSFTTLSDPATTMASFQQYTDRSTTSTDSLQQALSATHVSSDNDDFQNGFEEQHEGFSSVYGSDFHGISDYAYDGQYINAQFDESTSSYNDYSLHTIEGVRPVMMSSFPSQLLPGQSHDSADNQNSSEATIPVGFSYSTTASEESLSPPAPSLPFKPPQPTDIASRRKKVHNKPAALGTDNSRSRPPAGPRTVSHADGMRRHAGSPQGSPMRRINSAGGSSRNVISGRVNKSGIEPAQRSPINLGGFATTEAFMERNQQGIRYPLAMTSQSSLNGSLAPPTPMSPHGGEMLLTKSISVGSASPSDNGMNYMLNNGCYGSMDDQNLASPPETPQAPMFMPAAGNGWTSGPEMPERQWDYDVSDQPLYTPSHDSFLELHMPQPVYLATVSQPVTPLGQFDGISEQQSPSYMQIPGQTEYPFPDMTQYAMMADPNSAAARQKTFQFSNCTAADFSEK